MLWGQRQADLCTTPPVSCPTAVDSQYPGEHSLLACCYCASESLSTANRRLVWYHRHRDPASKGCAFSVFRNQQISSGDGRHGSEWRTSMGLGNIQSFLVHSCALPKQHLGQHAGIFDVALADLWGAYEEMSCYGAEVPLAVPCDGRAEVIQCYVPYLSGIQLFRADRPLRRRQRQCSCPGDDEPVHEGCEDAADCACSDGLSVGSSLDAPETETDSDGSDSEGHACSDLELKARWCAGRAAASHDRHSVLRKQQHPAELLFEHFEDRLPFEREPLTCRIQELAERCPQLLSLSLSDLHPQSWYSVAWYPIHRLHGLGRFIKELGGAFLTLHALSHPFASVVHGSRPSAPYLPAASQHALALRCLQSQTDSGCICMPQLAFGVLGYKLTGCIWADDDNYAPVHRPMTAAAAAWVEQRCRSRYSDGEFFLRHARPLPVQA